MSGLSFFTTSLFLFFFGAVIGSFLNVLIERSIEDRDWVKDRSRCNLCDHQLAWYDNIPLLSFFNLRGRCRHCQQKIDPAHLLMEILTGSLFVWWFWGGFILMRIFKLTQLPFVVIQPLFWLLAAIFLLVIFIYDLKYLVIPETVLWLLLMLVLTYRVWLVIAGIMQLNDLVWSLVMSAFLAWFLGFLWLVTKGRGMGLGDVKLIIPLSILVGYKLAPIGMMFAFVIGSVMSLVLLTLHRAKLGRVIPFGPYLIIGFGLSLFWGYSLLDWYLSMI